MEGKPKGLPQLVAPADLLELRPGTDVGNYRRSHQQSTPLRLAPGRNWGGVSLLPAKDTEHGYVCHDCIASPSRYAEALFSTFASK